MAAAKSPCMSPRAQPPSYLLTLAAGGKTWADLTGTHTHARTRTRAHSHTSKNTTQSELGCLEGAMPESCHLGTKVGLYITQD